MSTHLNVVGQSVGRSDGIGHVTGRTQYTADHAFPGMLHLKMVRSPLHHARIKGIDLSDAERVPGFVRALTARDVPHNRYTILSLIGVEPEEEFVLAEDRVRFKGEAIVAIVAETEEAALEAVSKVHLDLEELPAVFDVEEALKPGAPIVTHWGNNTFMYEGHPCRRVRLGDVEEAFEQADHIVEGVYNTSPIEHAPTETTGCIAVPEANGRYTVYTNTQALYFSLDNTSIILQVPGNRLHFVGGTVGGGFGGKVDVIVEPIATLAAMKTNRPVRFTYSRSEEMQVSSTRSAWRIYIKDGVTRDGHIIARKVTSYADSGAYSRQTPYALTKHAANAAGPYAIPNVSIDAYCVYTNRQPSSAMRGFGVTMASFALEVQMDKIAETGRRRSVDDPLHQRLPQRRHEAAPEARRGRDPDRDDAGRRDARRARAAGRAQGDDVGATRRRPRWRPLAMAKLRGTGIAAVNYPTGMNLGGDPSQALIHATTSGSFVVSLSAHRPRPGAEDGHRADRGRDAGRPVRGDRRRHRRHGYGPALHGDVRQPGHAPRGQRGDRGRHRGPPGPARSGRRRARGGRRRARDRWARKPDGQGRPGPVGEGRGHRLDGPVQVRQDDRRTRELHEAEERGGPGDRRHGSRLDRGARLHGGRGRGRHRHGRGHGPQHQERLRGGAPGQSGARPGPDRGRRLDGHVPRPVRDDRARTTRRSTTAPRTSAST